MERRKIYREVIWLIAIAFFYFLVKEILLPAFSGNSALDINVHDTYYIFPPVDSAWIFIPGLYFIIYLIRALITGFSNSVILLIGIISSVFVIGWLYNLTHTYYIYMHLPEINKLLQTDLKTPADLASGASETITVSYYTAVFVQIALVVFISFAGFKIGRNRTMKSLTYF